MKKPFRIVWITAIAAFAVFVLFASLDYYPFVGSDLVYRIIQGSAFVVCMVVAVCTYIIVKEINRNNKK